MTFSLASDFVAVKRTTQGALTEYFAEDLKSVISARQAAVGEVL